MTLAMQQPPSTVNLSTLPSEILLEIIPHIPHTPQNLTCICLTCRRLNELVTTHERGLVRSVKNTQFDRSTLNLFPGLAESNTYAGLRTLHNRLETLEDLHKHWLKIVNHGIELHWLKGRWEQIHKAGLLLLYRLQDTTTGYEGKVKLLQCLPATSLACLLSKMISSIKILRIYGPEPINQSFAREDAMVRSDVELAFEECLLVHGPEFFVAMLRDSGSGERKEWAVKILETEISGMYDRQAPSPTTGEPKPPTLISSLRRALAGKTGCEVTATVGKTWEILSCTGFDNVGEVELGAIVGGHELERGMRRIF